MNRADTIMARINELAAISDQPGAITRTYGSPAFLTANQLLLKWFKECGLQSRIDNIGNVRGRLNSPKKDAKTFVIASHADTVINAGRFDGPLGIIMGLELLDDLVKQGVELPFNIELVSFCDEEGVRFHTTYLGSKVVAGSFEDEMLHKKDDRLITLSQAISDMGGNASLLQTEAIAPGEWLGYFEIHIEQGPVLEKQNVPVGIVTSIAGQKRAIVELKGIAGHAGTVPMNMRHDALCCAAACILAIEKFAGQNEGIVATVGTINVDDAASNVIPGSVKYSVDLRSADEEQLETAWQSISTLINDICQQRKIEAGINLVQSSLPVKCNYHLNFLMKRAIAKLGYPVVEMMSGAGHDAVPVSAVSPVAMMFVRCFKGISHNPLEHVDKKDIAAAFDAAGQFLNNLIQYHNQP